MTNDEKIAIALKSDYLSELSVYEMLPNSRIRSGFDRRMKKIILTEKALEYQEQVKDGLMELEEDLVKGIPEEKLEIFLEVINRMINNLSD